MDIDDALLDEFVAEANEHLLSIEDDFLTLERQKEAPDPDLVDKLFRAIHSVKGGAAFVGLARIKELSHAMENLLSKFRAQELAISSQHIDALLKGVDLLNTMIGSPLESDHLDISELHGRIKSLLVGPPPAELPAVAPAIQEQPRPRPAAEPPVQAPTATVAEQGEPEPAAGAPAPERSVLVLAELPAHSTLELPPPLVEEALARHERVLHVVAPLGEEPEGQLEALEQGGEVLAVRLEHPEQDIEAGLPPDGFLRLAALLGSSAAPDEVTERTGIEGCEATLLRERAAAVEVVAAPDPGDATEHDGQAQTPLNRDRGETQASKTVLERGGSVRINVGLLDKLMTLAGELVLVRNQQLLGVERNDTFSRDMVQRLDMVTTELQETIMQTRMQPIGNVFNKMPRIVRDLSGSLDKEIEITTSGNEVELDKTILESLNDPLVHIVRNSCDHGIETPAEREAAGKSPTGQIRIHAFHEGGQINIEVSDDGQGISSAMVRKKALQRGLRSEVELSQMSDREVMSLIMLPGFSTAEQVSEVSGRGVGMDVVRHAIESLGGSVELESWVGEGATVYLRLPLTLAIIPCLIVMVGEHRFAIPQVNLEELVCLYDDEIDSRVEIAGNQEVYRLRTKLLPMVRLSEILARPRAFSRETKAEIAEHYHASDAKPPMPPPVSKATGYIKGRIVLPEEQRVPTAADSLSFAVVKVGSERFGLIVDKVLGTEEIVVKPMHPSLKSLRCYSGATVMGDGSVALILDIEGIARHAGVFLDQPEEEVFSKKGMGVSDEDTQSILLFRNGPSEQFALALPLTRRIEKISMQQVERVGNKEFITVEGQSTLVLRLDKLLTVSPGMEKDEMFLILPKFIKRPFGILMSEILDIEETPIKLNTDSYVEEGLLGTDIIREHLTLFPDIYRLIELAEPQWFAERRQAHPLPEGIRRILIVEDSSFMRHMLRRYLEADGYEVSETEHGMEALEMLEERQFDLIVSDIEMPVMDGLEFIRNLRHSGPQKDIPTLALTSLNTEEDKRRALAAGFDMYQVKIDRERFLADVTMLLTRGAPVRQEA